MTSSVQPEGVTIRCATLDDVQTLCEFRSRMFDEMGWSDRSRIDDLAESYAEYLRDTMVSGEAAGWIAEASALKPVAVGTACLVWKRVPPSLRNPDGREAYILGVFVDPEWRRRGIARELVQRAIDQATAEGAALVTLHASDAGRKVYDAMGFTDSHEMRLFTENAPAAAWRPAYDAD